MGYTPSFTPQYENGWEDLPIEETPITAEALNAYDDAIENIEEYLASDESQANLADAYDETATYEAGNYVIYGGNLYKCLEDIDTPEEWDSTKWESCLITNEMGSGGGGGSNVSITPTLSTGTKIADFEIDGESGELYAPTGGGGNANIWTGTQAELEEVFDELEEGTQINITDDEQEVVEGGTIYSEEEQIIGLWTDNKPLYQRTVNVTGLSKATTSTIAISASDLANLGIVAGEIHDTEFVLSYGAGGSENLFSQNIYLNSTNLIIVWTAGGNIYYQAQWGSATTADIGITFTFKYTKSTDAPLDVVVGKKTMYIASSDCYSTEEKEVGCWQDGKPLYQKTIELGTMPNNTTKNVAHNIANLDKVVSFQGYYKNPTSGSIIPLAFTHRSSVTYQLQLSINDTYVSIITATDESALTDCYLTIQYTKTTDTAGSGQYTPASGKAVHYSTDEQVIGTWVDGKPLYRKVLPTITFNNNYEYTHNLGIKYYINVGGNCTVNDGTNPLPFPFLQSRYNGYCNFQNTTPNSVTLDSSWNNNAVDCYIEYTKLSDYS